MSPEERGAMFDEFVQGGLLDDADVTLVTNRFATWDYNGKQPVPILALKVIMQDSEGENHEQYLSAGELKFFAPSTDGKRAVPVGNQTKLNVNTNAVEFLLSIMNADTKGELATKIRSTDDISILDGLKCHVIRKAQKKRSGILVQAAGEGNREKTVLTVDRIISYPWEGSTAAGQTKAAAGATPAAAAPAAGGSSETEDAAVGVLVQIVSDAGGSIKKSAVAGKVFANADMKAAAAPLRNAVLGLIVKDDFLGAEGRPWTYDKAAGTISLG